MKKSKLLVKKGLRGKQSLKKRKKPSVTTLKAKADKAFSLAVRLRDSDENGYGRCITCSKPLHYKKAHAGHFMSRRYGATRYDEENVNLQCSGCNTFNHGEQYRYGLEVDLKYGAGTAEKLHELAHSEFRMTTEFLEQVIKDSLEQIKYYEGLERESPRFLGRGL